MGDKGKENENLAELREFLEAREREKFEENELQDEAIGGQFAMIVPIIELVERILNNPQLQAVQKCIKLRYQKLLNRLPF